MSAEQSLKTSYTSFGIVLMLEGLAFLIFPNLTTKLLFLSPLETIQAEQYVRTTGLGVLVIGYYYYIAGRYILIAFFRASVIGRLFVLPVVLALIYFCSLEIPFILFGIQDLLTAFWSYTCLKAYDRERIKLRK